MKAHRTLTTVLLLVSALAHAGVEDDVARLRHGWEHIKYQMAPKDREQAFEKLAQESARVMAQYPRRAEPAIWHGIIEATYAGAKGGLGALSLAKAAKQSFEQALAIDPNALEGSAYTSLGSLYYQVPGWPIGFGDDGKALEFLKKGLALNPKGIDPNYFYGDYLYRAGDLDGAEAALRLALQAPARAGRELADEGRRREIRELLGKIREARR